MATTNSDFKEGLPVARLLMVLSSLAPLFILWAIRGNKIIPDTYFIGICMLMAIIPTTVLFWRIYVATKDREIRELPIGEFEDNRGHVFLYLFTILLPFYSEESASYRDLAAMIVALAFIVFIFWRFNLYYMNIIFAVLKYQIFMVSLPRDYNIHSGKENIILITHHRYLRANDRLHVYRLSNTVYLERKE